MVYLTLHNEKYRQCGENSSNRFFDSGRGKTPEVSITTDYKTNVVM